MTDNDNNLYEGFDEETQPTPEKPKGGANRTFLVAIGILGGIFLLSLIAFGVFAGLILPQRNAARRDQAAQIDAQNTATSQAATEVAKLAIPTATQQPTATSFFTPTPVVAIATKTNTPLPGTPTEIPAVGEPAARTATVAALLTQAVGGRTTPSSPTPTGLPNTGIGDGLALPILFGTALLLVVIIFIARRLRLATH